MGISKTIHHLPFQVASFRERLYLSSRGKAEEGSQRSSQPFKEVFYVTGCCSIKMTKTANNFESLNRWAFA
jgi:hypothetical protein